MRMARGFSSRAAVCLAGVCNIMRVSQFDFKAMVCGLILLALLPSAALASDPNDPNTPLFVSKAIVLFSAYAGGTNPGNQTLSVGNMGDGTFNWAITDANEPTYFPPAWLTITPVSGSLDPNESTTVTLSVNIAGLPEGSYSYVFHVTAPGAQNSPKIVTVKLQIPPTVLSVSKSSVSFSAYESGANPGNQTFTVSNTGGGTVNWSIDTSGKPAWLTIAPVSGSLGRNQSTTVVLSVNISGLTGGSYSYAFQVRAPGAQNSPRTVAVNLQITGPVLSVSKSSVSFTTYESGANPSNQTFTVSNTGGGIVNWSIDLSGKPAWLTIAPVSGGPLGHNQSSTVTLSVNVTGLSSGSYSYVFQVTAPGAQNSPKFVAVNVQVTGPVLNVSKNSISFAAYEPDTNPAPQTFTVSNSGGGAVNWSIDTSSKPAWLTVAPASGGPLGHNQSSTVTLSVETTGLANGPYSYSFQVTDPSAANSPQTISVNLGVGGIYVPGTYPTIQAAINAVSNGDTIIVLPGTYYENINFNGKNIVLTSIDPEDPAVVESTIIDGSQNGSVVTFAGTETSDSKLIGFTITNGRHYYYFYNGFEVEGLNKGSGICGNRSNATVYKCVIVNNHTSDFLYAEPCSDDACMVPGKGGGIAECDGLIMDCTIMSNTADIGLGGGLYDCDGTITNCMIIDNTATYRGGGLFGCDGPITDCIILANSVPSWGAWCYGGGLDGCDGDISNCVISENIVTGSSIWCYGGGLSDCNGTIVNCTISGNVASGYRSFGGGLFNCGGSISNCIIWDNSITVGSGAQLYQCNTPTYSCIQGWAEGVGNISSDPLFADVSSSNPNEWDFHLKSEYGRWNPNPSQWVYDDATSPCIDAGDPGSAWQAELWPHGGRINMGAYGGTAQASMSGHPSGSVADLNHDEFVNADDLILFVADWLLNEYFLDTDLDLDGGVNLADFSEFAGEWLLWDPLPLYLSLPTGLTATASYDQIGLNWNDHPSPYWTGFNVYRSTTPGSGYNLIAENLQVSEYTDLLTNSIRYYYVVTGVSSTGNESPYSNQVSAIRGQLEYQTFESGMGNWSNVTSGDTDQWYRDYGGTPTSKTGPSAGANGSSWYVYMDAYYAFTAGDSAILEGPELADSGRARAISFYYHMYGANMGTLNVDVYSNGASTNGVWSRSGQQHTSETAPYTKAVVDLGAYTGTIRVRFRGVAAGGYLGDMAIDDILIYEQ